MHRFFYFLLLFSPIYAADPFDLNDKSLFGTRSRRETNLEALLPPAQRSRTEKPNANEGPFSHYDLNTNLKGAKKQENALQHLFYLPVNVAHTPFQKELMHNIHALMNQPHMPADGMIEYALAWSLFLISKEDAAILHTSLIALQGSQALILSSAKGNIFAKLLISQDIFGQNYDMEMRVSHLCDAIDRHITFEDAARCSALDALTRNINFDKYHQEVVDFFMPDRKMDVSLLLNVALDHAPYLIMEKAFHYLKKARTINLNDDDNDSDVIETSLDLFEDFYACADDALKNAIKAWADEPDQTELFGQTIEDYEAL